MTDEQLVTQYTKGNDKALEILIQRYLPLVYGFSRRYSGDSDTAADIAQETFVKAWKNLKKFDTDKKFRNWLFAIAKNTALDWLKRKEPVAFSRVAENSNFEEASRDPILSIHEAMIKREAESCIDSALGALPQGQQVVLTLKHFDGLTFREIGKFLGEPLDTVKSRYRRALLAAKKVLARVDSY